MYFKQIFLSVFFTIICLINLAFAQADQEIGIMLGSSSYLGDIGGKNEARPLFLDLQITKTQPAIGILYRYQTDPLYAFKSHFFYGVISGDDALSQIDTRRLRNLSFKTSIFELSTTVEVELFELESRILSGSTFRRSVGNISSGHQIHVFFYLGLGGFYFNPTAEYNGTKYSLHKLGTEGQGIPGGPRKYSQFQLNIPLGFEVYYPLSPLLKLGFDIGLRKTFTDYLDDVGGNYFDPALIQQYYGNEAAALSNRTAEVSADGQPWLYSSPGSIRGNSKNTDYYFFTTFSLSYKFLTAKYYQPKFQRTSRSISKRLKQNRKRRY